MERRGPSRRCTIKSTMSTVNSTPIKLCGKSGPKDQVALHYYYTSPAFALVHDSGGIEIVNFTTAAALSAGTLMASAGTPYRLVPATFTRGALQSDGWNRVVAGRATCSVDDQVGDATCGQEVC